MKEKLQKLYTYALYYYYYHYFIIFYAFQKKIQKEYKNINIKKFIL